MNLNKETKPSENKRFVKDVTLSGIFAYICAICLLPSSDILSTLPVAFLLAAACSFFCKTRWFIYAFFALMPLLLNSLSGFSFERTIIVAIASLISAYLGVLAKRAVFTLINAKKKGDGTVFVKSVAVLCASIAVAVFVWIFVFGNPVSAMIKKSQSLKYVRETYGETVEISYTYYDVLRGQYLTKISFEEAVSGEDYYVSYPVLDGYENYCLELLTTDAKRYFKGHTTLDTENVKCYLDVSDKVISPGDNYKDYLSEFEYLIEISDEITGLRGFRRVYENLSEHISLSDSFEYKSITISGMDAAGNSYYAHLPHGERVRYYYADESFKANIDGKFYN